MDLLSPLVTCFPSYFYPRGRVSHRGLDSTYIWKRCIIGMVSTQSSVPLTCQQWLISFPLPSTGAGKWGSDLIVSTQQAAADLCFMALRLTTDSGPGPGDPSLPLKNEMQSGHGSVGWEKWKLQSM